MLKIIKVIFFISLIFSVLNLYSEDYSTIVQGDDEDVSELLQKALNQSILKVLGSRRDFNLNQQNFKKLKKNYSKGTELKGKTLGIIGFGRIGQETAKIALGIGMNVIYYDKFIESVKIELDFIMDKKISFEFSNKQGVKKELA